MIFRSLRSLWLVPFLFALVACAHDDQANKTDTTNQTDAVDESTQGPPPICPQVAIVRDLDQITDYGDETPAPDQTVAAARMLALRGTCEYKKDGIEVAFDLNMVARRGPRLGGLRASFPFFVAVINPAGTILTKEPLTAEIGFASDSRDNTHAEKLRVFISLAITERTTGPHYQVLTGFQLTQDQWASRDHK